VSAYSPLRYHAAAGMLQLICVCCVPHMQSALERVNAFTTERMHLLLTVQAANCSKVQGMLCHVEAGVGVRAVQQSQGKPLYAQQAINIRAQNLADVGDGLAPAEAYLEKRLTSNRSDDLR
jgi:hypothetical protein